MSNYEYKQEKAFVIEAAKRLGIKPGHGHAAVVLYGSSASVKVRLGQPASITVADFAKAVNALPNMYEPHRRMDKALRVARSELTRGGRGDLPKLVLLITNGFSYADANDLRQSYQLVRNDKAYVVAVGLQDSLKSELQLVTETDDDIFMLKNFQFLKGDVGKIISRAYYLIGKCR